MDVQDDGIYFRPSNSWSYGEPVILSINPDDPQHLTELEPLPDIYPIAKCNLLVHEIPLPSPEVPESAKEEICALLIFIRM